MRTSLIKIKKQVPVLINYTFGKERFEKSPDEFDIELLERIDKISIPYWFPKNRMPPGDESRRNDDIGFTHVHHFYSKRSLWILSSLWQKIESIDNIRLRANLKFMWQSLALGYTKLNRYGATHFSQVNRILSGTLYVSSLTSEVSLQYAFKGKLNRLVQAFKSFPHENESASITNQSSSEISIPDNTIDYIFIDPPFGNNLMYSELNFVWESWLRINTDNSSEAIVNKSQGKKLLDYQDLMFSCFKECFRLLKDDHWITVEFHNSQNKIWNAIQEAILKAGFVIADARILDKKQGTFKQVNETSAVKQDLVISAYKPGNEFEQRLLRKPNSQEAVWSFVKQHLMKLPFVVEKKGIIEVLVERRDFLLFDRMVAFFIQRGLAIPMSSGEFYSGLKQRFPERDGMFFLEEQIHQYEQARLQAQEVAQLTLFVSDEKSAIQWLRQLLDPTLGGEPQTYQDIQPQFLRQLHQAKHEVLPELRDLLEQSFLQDEAERWYVPDPNKATDLEQLRHRALMREFATYFEGKKKLKQFRTEAVRAGFADAWAKREYATIVQVAERLPETVLQEDPDLLMYYDNASLRV